ncbi:Ig-like domain repeat protein, partial [bacterium]|nr:Ig-like domain repeat protein [bacterium]
GTTYRITIDTYAAEVAGTAGGKTHGTYDVTISNGSSSVTVLGSGFRSAAYNTGGYLTFASQQNTATDDLAFSVDSIEMTSLNVLEPTATTLTSNTNPANLGDSVTLTATVTSGTGTPTGSITFFDGVTNLGTSTLNGSGVATFVTSALASGSHSITASYAATAIYAASVSAELTQTIQALPPYQTWLAGYFNATDLANPAREATVWGPLADPDGDSLVNLLEYALELSPMRSNPPPPGLQATGSPLSLTFKRARAELTYSVQAGGNLTTWQDLATNSFPVGTTGTVTDTAPASEPRRLLRLQVSQP